MDKILKDRAYDIAMNPKYDGYQRGLASTVYTFFFDKKTESGAKASVYEELAQELQKPVIKNSKGEPMQDLNIIFGQQI